MNIRQIDLIGIPVTDQQVALEFYTKILGFEERVNMAHLEDENTRWIELVPPGAQTSVVLASWEKTENFITFILLTTDIEADYAELKAKGLDLSPLEHQPWGISVEVADPDGNKLLLQQNVAMSG